MSEEFPVQLAGLPPGSHLAGYRIEAPLGAGGMAVVYLAHDEQLKRPVALKVFAPVTAPDQLTRRRFLDESRAAAAVDHEHIIPIYDAGQARGYLFIAMRLVRGGDLRGLLEREGALPPARAAGIVSQVASALDAAHGAGLVHRDVEPANILLATPAGEPDYVYLSDFGVSKQATRPITLTGTGQFLGTPDYAAPEQGRDVRLDGRADQYALACVAYHLLTGAPPFERESPTAVLMAQLSEPPPSVRVRRPELPEAVDQVLARALAKVPEKRYRSCREFADALRGALGRAAVPAGPPMVTSTDRVSADRPANRSWQTTQSGSVPAKGSSLLQPTPPSAGPSRPGRFAADWSRGVMRLGEYGMGDPGAGGRGPGGLQAGDVSQPEVRARQQPRAMRGCRWPTVLRLILLSSRRASPGISNALSPQTTRSSRPARRPVAASSASSFSYPPTPAPRGTWLRCSSGAAVRRRPGTWQA